jgi:hypothetical protein
MKKEMRKNCLEKGLSKREGQPNKRQFKILSLTYQ